MKYDEANRRIAALTEFADAIGTFNGLSQIDYDGCQPRPGREQEWSEAKARVDRLVMKAGRSFATAGVWVEHSPPGTHASQPVDPASLWQVCLQPNSWYPLADLHREINRAIGSIEDKRDDPPRQSRDVSLQGFSIGGWMATVSAAVVAGLIVALVVYQLGWVGS